MSDMSNGLLIICKMEVLVLADYAQLQAKRDKALYCKLIGLILHYLLIEMRVPEFYANLSKFILAWWEIL